MVTNEIAAPTELTGGFGRRLALVALVLLAGLVVLERAHTRDETPERDIGEYAVFGHELNRGRSMYTDLWERRSPLLFLTFAAAERIAGYGPDEILVVNVTAALVVLVAVWSAGGAVGGPAGCVLAGALWVGIGGDLTLEANQPNAELLVNACLAPAVAILVRWPTRRATRVAATASVGVLFAAATLYKHHVVVTCVALAAGHVLAGGRTGWCRRSIEGAGMGAVIVIAWAVTISYFAAVGRGGLFAYAILQSNVAYGGNFAWNLAVFFRPDGLWKAFAGCAGGPVLLMVVAGAAGLARRRWGDRGPWLIWLAWAAGAWPAVALPGKYWYHYYQYWLPILALGGGWAAAELLRPTAGRSRPSGVAVVAVAIGLAVTVFQEGANYLLSADEWARRKATGNMIEPQRRIGGWLARALQPGETFWNFGEDPNLYLLARRSPPTGLLFYDQLAAGPRADDFRRRLMTDIRSARPDLIVISPGAEGLTGPDRSIQQWIDADYDRLPGDDQGYAIAVRRGSNLAARMRRG